MKKKILKGIFAVFAIVALLMNSHEPSVYARYAGSDSYSGSWTEGVLAWKNKYTYSAKYSNSFVTLLDNLSGTKYWDNYNNAKKTAQSMQIGISKQITVSQTKATTVSGNVGFKVPVKAVEVSGEIGGSYTNSKTYSKTVGTSSAYTINTKSKNGYYAVTHAVNCDAYNVTIKKNGSFYESGKLIRYATTNGYEKLWYKTSSF